MREPRETLIRIIDLEAQRGFHDGAVIGGLAEFARNWVAGSPAGVDAELLRSVEEALGEYASLDMDSRKSQVSRLRALLVDSSPPRRSAKTAAPTLTPTSARKKSPPSASKQTRVRSGTSLGQGTLRATDDPGLSRLVSDLRGIGDRATSQLARLGLRRIGDLLWHAPLRYDDFSRQQQIGGLKVGEAASLQVTVRSIKARKIRGGRTMVDLVVADETGALQCAFFNQAYLVRQLKSGQEISLSGTVERRAGKLSLKAPQWERAGQSLHTAGILPIYPLTDGLYQRNLRRWIKTAVDAWVDGVGDPLPPALREAEALVGVPQALREIHAPSSPAALEQARHRLAVDELLGLQLWSRQRRLARAAHPAPSLEAGRAELERFIDALPWPLTPTERLEGEPPRPGQAAALEEIALDLERHHPMSRLLQGDVGCGKTAVAGGAIAMCVGAGYQAAIMAPTEILAQQHSTGLSELFGEMGYVIFDPDEYLAKEEAAVAIDEIPSDAAAQGSMTHSLQKLMIFDEDEPDAANPAHRTSSIPSRIREGRPPSIARLVGSMTAKQKATTARALAAGDIDIAIGTHALIQDHVGFERLGLTVVDEQHRFGVMQRAELQVKGRASDTDTDADADSDPDAVADTVVELELELESESGEDQAPTPHVLVMTATPIPRTLALAINADLDQTVIGNMPPGRKPIKTYWLAGGKRERAYHYIRQRVAQGQQAYVVCPLVEASESIDAKSAIEEHERLQTEVLMELKLGLLHGRMRPAEKEAVMGRFKAGEIEVLVSTSVIEVGVDVPNATVMLIESADRFGLAQLHQFRGRVGRGAEESVCLLVSDDAGRKASERLKMLASTTDGLKLAEFDLETRGPGDYFGLQQSGVVDRFRFARLAPTLALAVASRLAEGIMREDPALEARKHLPLAKRVEAFREAASRA